MSNQYFSNILAIKNPQRLVSLVYFTVLFLRLVYWFRIKLLSILKSKGHGEILFISRSQNANCHIAPSTKGLKRELNLFLFVRFVSLVHFCFLDKHKYLE